MLSVPDNEPVRLPETTVLGFDSVPEPKKELNDESKPFNGSVAVKKKPGLEFKISVFVKLSKLAVPVGIKS